MSAGLSQRVLRVTFHMPGGDVVFNKDVEMKVRVSKDCRASQNHAVIEITNLTQSFRQNLLSQFTAFSRRKTQAGQNVPVYLDMEIAAGYVFPDGRDTTATIYHGQVVECGLVSGLPNVRVRIDCYTHQVDKTLYIDQPPPYEMTFRQLVFWAGEQMGFDPAHVICETSKDEMIVTNAARSTVVAGMLPDWIEQYFYADVAAYVDDNFLIVKDRYAVLNPGDTVSLTPSDFVNTPPMWNAWGVEFSTLFNPAIKCAQVVNVDSQLNPAANGAYIVMGIEYELTSRDNPFYCHVVACPPA